MRAHFQATGLSKTFNRRKIFSNISFTLKEEDSLAIAGRNGSGKSTLLKILAGVLSPTRGSLDIQLDGSPVVPADRYSIIGLVAPYLQLYDEFTGWENLDIYRRVRNVDASDGYLTDLLKRVNLSERKDDFVRTYSSGMKQRLKYAFALVHRPPILLLDEPTSNLDQEGTNTVHQIMEEQKQHGIIIVATNETEDLKYCANVIDLNQPKPAEVPK